MSSSISPLNTVVYRPTVYPTPTSSSSEEAVDESEEDYPGSLRFAKGDSVSPDRVNLSVTAIPLTSPVSYPTTAPSSKIIPAPSDGIAARIKLLNSIYSHEIELENISLAQMFKNEPCSVSGLLSLLGSTKLGAGKYGTVYAVPAGELTFILKQITFKNPPGSPEQSENVEVAVFKYLNQITLLEKRSPHLPLYMGDFECIQETQGVRYLLAERANGDLKGTLATLTSLELRILIFQVLWTLAVIQNIAPSFRHNDLHLGNILIFNQTPDSNSTAYRRDAANIWYLPHTRFSPALWDFGLSNLSNIMNRSAKTLELGNIGVGTGQNRFMDMAKLLNTLYRQVGDPEFRAFVKRVIPPIDTVKFFGSYWAPVFDYEYTTPEQALNDPYFNIFRAPVGAVIDEYSFAGLATSKPARVFTSSTPKILCQAYQLPLIVARDNPRPSYPCATSLNIPPIANPKPDPRWINYYANQLTLNAFYNSIPLAIRSVIDTAVRGQLPILYSSIISHYLVPAQLVGFLIGYLMLKLYYYYVRYWFLTTVELAAMGLSSVPNNVAITVEAMLQIDSILTTLGIDSQLRSATNKTAVNNILAVTQFLR